MPDAKYQTDDVVELLDAGWDGVPMQVTLTWWDNGWAYELVRADQATLPRARVSTRIAPEDLLRRLIQTAA